MMAQYSHIHYRKFIIYKLDVCSNLFYLLILRIQVKYKLLCACEHVASGCVNTWNLCDLCNLSHTPRKPKNLKKSFPFFRVRLQVIQGNVFGEFKVFFKPFVQLLLCNEPRMLQLSYQNGKHIINGSSWRVAESHLKTK